MRGSACTGGSLNLPTSPNGLADVFGLCPIDGTGGLEMRQRLRPHANFANGISLIALFVALGGTTYAATGGNFILGQSNSAGAPTKLSSPTSDSAGALRVANSSTTGAGNGVVASGAHGGFGVWASGGDASKNKAAIHGQSGAGNAVEGISGKNTASGVYGENNSTGFGVAGRAANGTGVMGDSLNGWAMQAFGNVTQTRGQSGFVKAMAYVNPNNSFGDYVGRCFNSRRPPGQATSNDCGITYTRRGLGKYELDFGFAVTDRFALVTATATGVVGTVCPCGYEGVPTVLSVDTVTYNGQGGYFAYRDIPFFIVVY